MNAGADARAIRAWVLYDWANSAFATTIMAAVLPVYFSTVAAADLPRATASSYWGYTNSISMLAIALAAPVLGAIADYGGSKKRFLAGFLVPGVLFTALLVAIGRGDWFWAALLFVLAEIGFSGTIVFYDALLPHVAPAGQIDQVSARGYAAGYLGGGLLLALNIAWITAPRMFGLDALGARLGIEPVELGTRLSFLSVAVWWAAFSIPLFLRVGEPAPRRLEHEARVNPLRGGFGRLARTFREVRRFRQLMLFIAAFWIFNDGIGTIIKMATIYGAEVGIGRTDLIGALLVTQFVGIPFALMFGVLPRPDHPRQPLLLSLLVYNALTIPLIGWFAGSLGVTSGPRAVVALLLNQLPGLALSWLVGRRALAPFAARMTTKASILLSLAVYALISIWAYFLSSAVDFWLLAWMVGLVQGGSQALSRSLFGSMTPRVQSAEFFGFYDMSSKFAGLIGPLLFAVVGQLAGSSRLGIGSLLVFFVVGGALLLLVDEREGVRIAAEEDARTASA
ncbi:MAG: MFS transporter [Acidobacteria bacterium]|nr:MFS transporter [Acidobacteriota bacterium]